MDLALAIFDKMKNDPGQQRWECVWEPKLAAIALARVSSMALTGWHHHTDPQGYGPNWWVTHSGWKLPAWYSQADDANTIESLEYGGDMALEDIWALWMGSPTHKDHLLGLKDTFQEQSRIGVGCYFLKDSEAGLYCSVLSTPKEGWNGEGHG